MFLTDLTAAALSPLSGQGLDVHDLLQSYSRTNRVEKETYPFGIIFATGNLKKRTRRADTLL
jgi:type I restriction enzyme R subunit